MTDTENQRDQPGFGKRLRTEREARQLSLQDIASRLRLNPNVIHLLESGHFHNAPPAIFMRGYLRSYARLLEFGERDIDTALLESGLIVNIDAPLMPRNKTESSRPANAPWLHWISGGVLIALALLVFVWWNAYPVTLVREKLTGHLSMAADNPAPQIIQTAEVQASNDKPAEVSAPAVPEVPLVLPTAVAEDTTAKDKESVNTDPS